MSPKIMWIFMYYSKKGFIFLKRVICNFIHTYLWKLVVSFNKVSNVFE